MSANPEEPTRSRASVLVWVLPLAAVIALGGGSALLWASQSGALGDASSDGPGLRSREYDVGQQVEIWRQQHWYAGVIKQRDEARYLVRYQRTNLAPDEWVDATRLQPPSGSSQ